LVVASAGRVGEGLGPWRRDIRAGKHGSPDKPVVLRPGESVRLSGSVDADMSVVSREMSWRSSNPLVAVVDLSGGVTAISPGTVTIVATAEADPSAMGARLVTVSR
jgi:hypothetical protein